MVVFFVCLFCFVVTLSDVGYLCPMLAKKIESLIELRMMLLKKKLFDVQLGNYLLTPSILIFCRFTRFTKMQLTLLLDGYPPCPLNFIYLSSRILQFSEYNTQIINFIYLVEIKITMFIRILKLMFWILSRLAFYPRDLSFCRFMVGSFSQGPVFICLLERNSSTS